MPRHPSVPDYIGWIRLGVVTTDTAMLAFVAPEMSGLLSDIFMSHHLDEEGEPLPAELQTIDEDGEVELSDQGQRAVLAAVYADGAYIVEGRMADVGDGAELREIRIRLWICECTCHVGEEPDEHLCEGDCHDADPDPSAG